MSQQPRQQPPGQPRPKGQSAFHWTTLILVAAFAFLIFYLSKSPNTNAVSLPYSKFLQQIDAGNVASVTMQGQKITGTFKSSYVVSVDSS